MRIDRRLTLLGVMLVILSTVMATQYATTKIGYSYSIVHPSNADIRFIASDNSSDGVHVLRVDGSNDTGYRNIKVNLGGNWSERTNKTYTAAFGIVNEEYFPVTISHAVVTTNIGYDYMQIYLHGDRDAKADLDNGILIWNKNATAYTNGSVAWILGAGNGNAYDMDGTNAPTRWNDTSHVRYSYYDTDAVNGTDDYVWVQISLDIPDGANSVDASGQIYLYFNATTIDES